MDEVRFYAINNAGRQRIYADSIMDAAEYCFTHDYWVRNPPTKLIEERKYVFNFPEDFQD